MDRSRAEIRPFNKGDKLVAFVTTDRATGSEETILRLAQTHSLAGIGKEPPDTHVHHRHEPLADHRFQGGQQRIDPFS